MTGHARGFVVPDIGVDLKRARTPVVEVIERRADPVTDDDDHGQDRDRDQHGVTRLSGVKPTLRLLSTLQFPVFALKEKERCVLAKYKGGV